MKRISFKIEIKIYTLILNRIVDTTCFINLFICINTTTNFRYTYIIYSIYNIVNNKRGNMSAAVSTENNSSITNGGMSIFIYSENEFNYVLQTCILTKFLYPIIYF